MVLWSGKRIKSLTLFRDGDGFLPTKGIFSLQNLPFILLYAWAFHACYATIGQQYQEALDRADEEGWELPNTVDSQRSALSTLIAGAGEELDAAAATPVVGGSIKRLPWRHLPGFWPLFYLGAIAILHGLVILVQVWSIRIRCWFQMRSATPENATFVKIEPRQHGGKVELQPICTGPSGKWFEYHRRKYVYKPSTDTFEKVRCPTALPFGHFRRWRGLPSPRAVELARTQYGPNRFEMATPEFWALYRQQLLSPFTIFQLFCTGLWLLDEYWQYSCFTLFMILTFEGTVVMQRLKSINTLKGMGLEDLPLQVYRGGRWGVGHTSDLLPGDLFSLKLRRNVPGAAASSDLVPCDCLLLTGSCVLNESTLTGESVPQMKEGLLRSSLANDEVLDLKANNHKVHTLFGGTKLLTASAQEEEGEGRIQEEKGDDAMPVTPDGGSLAYVLRTGFSSSQGKLVRMIEGSTETVRTDTKDTTMLLLLLLVFAVGASGYVLREGMAADAKRSKYQLLLHCILIITSVIPPELPMQMALAVNSSLLTLMKMNVFCTEPYRIPMAGKIDVCLFDKTGTLTTDELVAVGIAPANDVGDTKTSTKDSKKGSISPDPDADAGLSVEGNSLLVRMQTAPPAAVMVLAGCHSLIHIEGKVAGDPLESASIKAVRWELVDGRPGTSRPKPEKEPKKPATSTSSSTLAVTNNAPKKAGKPIIVDGIPVAETSIQARHHFSSALQRMSVVVQTRQQEGGGGAQGWVLAKGSPEAIALLLAPGRKPADYEDRARRLAKDGMRVLALAYKPLTQNEVRPACLDRALAESSLLFAGFVAFTCRVRRDTSAIIQQLREGGHAAIMVTGDALLTGLHVAKEVGLTDTTPRPQLSVVPETAAPKNNDTSQFPTQEEITAWWPSSKSGGILTLEERPLPDGLCWCDYNTGNVVEAFDIHTVKALALNNDLAVSGGALAAAATQAGVPQGGSLPGDILQLICVFARMRPLEKERIIVAMQAAGLTCMMCGDGANDVGALKQAEVGVALLSGFGDVNVDRGNAAGVVKKVPKVPAVTSQAQVNQLLMMGVSELKTKLKDSFELDPSDDITKMAKQDLVQLYVRHSRLDNGLPLMPADARALQTKRQAEQKQKMTEQKARMLEAYKVKTEELKAAGENPFIANFKAIKMVQAEEIAKARASQGTGIEGSASKMAAMMQDLEDGETPVVKLGDASVASPFTSKMPSIRGCVDIIRQGRCTLVTSIQMYQILALQCLISAYSLSVLYLEGVKKGDHQMTALGMLMSVSYVTISRAKPLPRLSPVRPLTSIFEPALILSVFGQFALHLFTMMYSVAQAKKHLPADYTPDLDGPFTPNLINGVVFLVEAVQMVSVFVVNLKGRPFMGGLTENRPLLYSLAATFALVFMSASETIPRLNKYLQLEPFPDDAFRTMLLTILALDIGAAFIWDRLMLLIFAPHILIASFKGTTTADVMKVTRSMAICIFLIYYIANLEELDELDGEGGLTLPVDGGLSLPVEGGGIGATKGGPI